MCLDPTGIVDPSLRSLATGFAMEFQNYMSGLQSGLAAPASASAAPVTGSPKKTKRPAESSAAGPPAKKAKSAPKPASEPKRAPAKPTKSRPPPSDEEESEYDPATDGERLCFSASPSVESFDEDEEADVPPSTPVDDLPAAKAVRDASRTPTPTPPPLPRPLPPTPAPVKLKQATLTTASSAKARLQAVKAGTSKVLKSAAAQPPAVAPPVPQVKLFKFTVLGETASEPGVHMDVLDPSLHHAAIGWVLIPPAFVCKSGLTAHIKANGWPSVVIGKAKTQSPLGIMLLLQSSRRSDKKPDPRLYLTGSDEVKYGLSLYIEEQTDDDKRQALLVPHGSLEAYYRGDGTATIDWGQHEAGLFEAADIGTALANMHLLATCPRLVVSRRGRNAKPAMFDRLSKKFCSAGDVMAAVVDMPPPGWPLGFPGLSEETEVDESDEMSVAAAPIMAIEEQPALPVTEPVATAVESAPPAVEQSVVLPELPASGSTEDNSDVVIVPAAAAPKSKASRKRAREPEQSAAASVETPADQIEGAPKTKRARGTPTSKGDQGIILLGYLTWVDPECSKISVVFGIGSLAGCGELLTRLRRMCLPHKIACNINLVRSHVIVDPGSSCEVNLVAVDIHFTFIDPDTQLMLYDFVGITVNEITSTAPQLLLNRLSQNKDGFSVQLVVQSQIAAIGVLDLLGKRLREHDSNLQLEQSDTRVVAIQIEAIEVAFTVTIMDVNLYFPAAVFGTDWLPRLNSLKYILHI